MKADKIQISHYDFLTIKSLEIDRAVGEHGTAVIRGYISDDRIEEYKIQVLDHIWITITAEDENGEAKVIMTGIVAGFSFEQQPHDCMMTLILKSGTYLMERGLHFRSFQNTALTYVDVLNTINQPYGSFGVVCEECIKTTPLDFLLQYKESDWAFVKRIASHFGLAVTPSITGNGVFYYIGNTGCSSYSIPAGTNFHVSKRIDAFMTNGANGQGSAFEQDYLEYRIMDREIYDLWDRLMLQNEGGHVFRIHSEYIHEELLHTYYLRPSNGLGVLRTYNVRQSGCSFQGAVSEVMQAQVRIALIGDENSSQAITRWFPFSTGYSSPDGAGWYCMPEVGDRVRLQIPDQMEEHGYVISAVHMETGKDRKNPEHKSFKTKYGKELLFTPGSVELTNNQGMSVKIVDGEGIQITSSKNISITSRGNMMISSEGASLVIAGTESVDVRQGGAGFHLDDDITFTGGKFRIQ